MPEKQSGEPRQRTDKGLAIPVPKRKDVLDALKKAAKPGEKDPSRSDPGKR